MFNLKNVKVLSSAILLSLVAASPALAADTQTGSINFQGFIYNSTCDITINGLDQQSANVNMGSHGTSKFGGVAGTEVEGDGAQGLVKFALSECPDEGRLTIELTGETVDGDPSIYKLTNESSAEGVGIRLYPEGKSGNVQDAIWSGQDLEMEVEDAEGYEVSYRAFYISTDKKVTAGTAEAVINYNITYD